MTGTTSRGRPLKYGEPTKRRHVHIPESVLSDLTDLAQANGDLSIGELLVRGASLLLEDPTRAGLQAPEAQDGESSAQDT